MKLALKRTDVVPRPLVGYRWLAGAAAVVAVAGYLRLHEIGHGGLGNPFYAATVRSMTDSLHNAFFVSFDPLGTFMADKPPLALWLQTLSSLVFGYGGFALVVPQALAGIVAVSLTWIILRRTHGELAALAAAATLAVLPASVLVSRNNTMDTLVMALSLGAALLTLVAASSGRLLPLVGTGVLLGLAFNTKGFEAFVALPGIVAAYWLGAGMPALQRLGRLGLMGVIATIVGLSWITAVSLFPESERPLVLNSDGNSIWDLTFGYNGFDRVLGSDGFNPANALTTNAEGVIPTGVLYGGERGPLRIFGEFPGPLLAAALPAAFAGVFLLLADARDRRRRAGTALWVSWLAAGLVAFSASRLGSPHYLEAFSPAVAICVGVAAAGAVSGSRTRRAVSLTGFAFSALYALDRLTELGDAGAVIKGAAFTALACAGLSIVVLAAMPSVRLPALALSPFLAVLAILFAMSYQAIRDAPVEGVQPGLVLLSEDRSRDVRYDPASYSYSFITGNYAYLSRALDYLEQRRRAGQYVAVVRSFYMAGAIISQRDEPVLPLYSEFRSRAELPVDRLKGLLDEGKVEHVLVSLPFLRAIDPASAGLIESRCREDLSRRAGLPAQTGMQLLHCE